MKLNVDEMLKSSFDLEFVTRKLQKENEMRRENKFCDVTLKINNKDLFKVHKTIIASSCDYFSGLFNGDWKESREDVIVLDYEIIPECFELLLEYLYIGKLSISVFSYEYALILHKAALFFNLLKLKDIMSKILQKFITSETLLDLWHHGGINFDVSLRDKCLELISKNSTDFLKHNLLKLTFEELKSFCENNTLNCTQEEIYENFMKWIKADFESRAKYLKDLLDLVDFSKISGKFLKLKILSDKTLYKNEDFIKKIMSELSNSFEVNAQMSVACARNPNLINLINANEFNKLNIILISNNGIFIIDLDNKVCVRRISHKINRSFAITNFGFNNILICGGAPENSKVCKYYCPEINQFREFPPMLTVKTGHRAISLGDNIYVIGGTCTDTMEIFQISTGKWNLGQKMLRQRWSFALEEYGGCVYLMGGGDNCFDDRTRATPSDIFDIGLKKWIDHSTLKSECFKSVRIDSSVYLFKSDGYHKYDFKTKILKENCAIFPEKLLYYDAVKYNNEILLFGKRSSGVLFSALIDIATEKLTDIKIDLSQCGDIGNEFYLTTAHV